MGIINGYSDGSFKPTNSINRAETAKLIYALYEQLNDSSKVADLENRIEILETQMSTLSLPGDCYYNNTWYSTGDTVPQDNVCETDVCGPGSCTCQIRWKSCAMCNNLLKANLITSHNS